MGVPAKEGMWELVRRKGSGAHEEEGIEGAGADSPLALALMRVPEFSTHSHPLHPGTCTVSGKSRFSCRF